LGTGVSTLPCNVRKHHYFTQDSLTSTDRQGINLNKINWEI
jgi:hypothetical protein